MRQLRKLPHLFSGDSVGIRTQDPQLRRLLLYPAELPNLESFGWARMLATENSVNIACFPNEVAKIVNYFLFPTFFAIVSIVITRAAPIIEKIIASTMCPLIAKLLSNGSVG